MQLSIEFGNGSRQSDYGKIHKTECRDLHDLDTSHYAVPKLIEKGWSLWVGQRNRRTYCPEHGPTVPMRRM